MNIKVNPKIVSACDGNVYDAILLSLIAQYHELDEHGKPKELEEFSDHLWVAKTHEEWMEELGYNSKRTVAQCLERLSRKGYIVKERHKSKQHNWQVVSFVRLDWATYLDAMEGGK